MVRVGVGLLYWAGEVLVLGRCALSSLLVQNVDTTVYIFTPAHTTWCNSGDRLTGSTSSSLPRVPDDVIRGILPPTPQLGMPPLFDERDALISSFNQSLAMNTEIFGGGHVLLAPNPLSLSFQAPMDRPIGEFGAVG